MLAVRFRFFFSDSCCISALMSLPFGLGVGGGGGGGGGSNRLQKSKGSARGKLCSSGGGEIDEALYAYDCVTFNEIYLKCCTKQQILENLWPSIKTHS
jgi:hypothetical protein